MSNENFKILEFKMLELAPVLQANTEGVGSIRFSTLPALVFCVWEAHCTKSNLWIHTALSRNNTGTLFLLTHGFLWAIPSLDEANCPLLLLVIHSFSKNLRDGKHGITRVATLNWVSTFVLHINNPILSIVITANITGYTFYSWSPMPRNVLNALLQLLIH